MPRKPGKPAKKFQKVQQNVYTPYTALTLNEDCLIDTYGDAASNLFGYPEDTMLGKPLDKILPALSGKLEGMLANTAEPIELKEVRMQARHADGNIFPVSVGLRQDYQQGYCRHLVLVRNLQERPKS